MKKLIAMFVAAAAVSTALATDSYLYWFASPDTVGDIDFAYAQVVAQKDGEGKIYISDYYANEGSKAAGDSHVSGAWTGNLAEQLTGDYSAYNYYMELLNADEDTVWTGYNLSYSDFVKAGAVYAKGGSPVGSPVDMGGVPEPTSGLMLLIGMAMLGLKRKRA